jgi:hypothetical protein
MQALKRGAAEPRGLLSALLIIIQLAGTLLVAVLGLYTLEAMGINES